MPHFDVVIACATSPLEGRLCVKGYHREHCRRHPFHTAHARGLAPLAMSRHFISLRNPLLIVPSMETKRDEKGRVLHREKRNRQI